MIRTRRTPGQNSFGRRSTALIAGLLATVASSSGAAVGTDWGISKPIAAADYEWVEVTYGDGIRVDVAVFKPDDYSDSGNHPLILALPWGAGTPDLTLGMVDAYWNGEASRRGYVVVAPSIVGSSLETEADEFIPGLFAWLDENVSYDSDRVVVVGASNGGRGAFHALASDPTRFAAVIAMPGNYTGRPEALAAFAGKPIWLMVGEMDSRWHASTEATRVTLEAAGVTPRVNMIRGQGHVLRLDDRILMDWLDEVLAGP
jgi:predicted peptidase